MKHLPLLLSPHKDRVGFRFPEGCHKFLCCKEFNHFSARPRRSPWISVLILISVSLQNARQVTGGIGSAHLVFVFFSPSSKKKRTSWNKSSTRKDFVKGVQSTRREFQYSIPTNRFSSVVGGLSFSCSLDTTTGSTPTPFIQERAGRRLAVKIVVNINQPGVMGKLFMSRMNSLYRRNNL